MTTAQERRQIVIGELQRRLDAAKRDAAYHRTQAEAFEQLASRLQIEIDRRAAPR